MYKKKRKLWLIPVIAIPVLIVVIVVVVLVIKGVMKKLPMNATELVAVEEQDLSDYMTLKGTLSGETVTNVTSKASAEVLELKVQVGDKVKKGDVLCILDSGEIEKKLDQANTSLSNSNAVTKIQNKEAKDNLVAAQLDQIRALDNAQKAIEKAQANYNTAKNKADTNHANREANEKALNELKTAKANAEKALVDAYNADSTNAGKEITSGSAIEPTTVLGTESWAEEYKAYTEACTNYANKAPGYETAIATYKAEAEGAYGLDAMRDSAYDALESAKKAYEDLWLQTTRQVSNAQDAVEMRKYSSDNSQLTETVENLEEQYEGCVIYAPADGVVTAIGVAVGDIVIAEKPIITIEDEENMKLVLNVDEKNIIKLAEGMPAVITNDYMKDVEINGAITRVVKVKGQADMTGRDGGYCVEISFKNTCGFLLGMSGKAKIYMSKRAPGLAVPYDLVKEDEDGNSYVLIAKDNGNGTYTAKKEIFTPGEEVNYYVEVKGGNIKAGDLLPNNPLIQEGATFPAKTDYFMTEGDKK